MSRRQYKSFNGHKRRGVLVSQEKDKASMMSSPLCFYANLKKQKRKSDALNFESLNRFPIASASLNQAGKQHI